MLTYPIHTCCRLVYIVMGCMLSQARDDELDRLHHSLRHISTTSQGVSLGNISTINISNAPQDVSLVKAETWTKCLEQAIERLLRKNSMQVLRRATLHLWSRKIGFRKRRNTHLTSRDIHLRVTLREWGNQSKKGKRSRAIMT